VKGFSVKWRAYGDFVPICTYIMHTG